MAFATTREQRRALIRANAAWPATLREVERKDWPAHAVLPPNILKVFRSRDFIVQVYDAPAPAVCRLSIHRPIVDASTGRWKDGIAWEEIQALKREAGYGTMWAVEVYPTDFEVVNVANMRHVWIVPPESVPFAWRRPR